MQAGDVMTRDVTTVSPDTPIVEAASLMVKHNVSGLPVINGNGKLAGIVTESDFLRPVGSLAGRRRWFEVLMQPELTVPERLWAQATRVRDIMTPNPIAIREDTPLQDAVRLMAQHDVKRLVVTSGGKLVGIVSRADLLSALARALGAASVGQREHQRERRRMADLERQLWMRRLHP